MARVGEEELKKIESVYKTAIAGLEELEKELKACMLWSEQIEIQIHKRSIRKVMEFWLSKQTRSEVMQFGDRQLVKTEYSANVSYHIWASRPLLLSEVKSEIALYVRMHGEPPSDSSPVTIYSRL